MEKTFAEVEKEDKVCKILEKEIMAKLKFKNDSRGESPFFIVHFKDSQSKSFPSGEEIGDFEKVQKINCRQEQNLNVPKLNQRRPQSAGCRRSVSPVLCLKRKKRPKSCCSFLYKQNKQKEDVKENSKRVAEKRLCQIKNLSEPQKINYQKIANDSHCCCSCFCSSKEPNYSKSCEIFDYHHCRKKHCFCTLSRCMPHCLCHNVSSASTDKMKSLSRMHNEKYIWNYRRSLTLLGFQPSDFGIQPRVKNGKYTARKCSSHSSFSTKVISRSYSLDCLRETIKEAWMEDCIGVSHRKILAQAAYEEWYLKKEKELIKKREETKLKEIENKENLERDLKNKEEKARLEFRKWLQRKKIKLKEKSESLKKLTIENKITRKKSPEETENAFLKWKKEKDLKLLSRNKEKRREEEIKIEMEKQKKEQKILAEKAYEVWKKKMEEKIKLRATQKLKKKKLEQSESEKKMMREKESQTSFEIWKAIKDEQLQKRMQHNKTAAKLMEEKRQAMLEERLYEADQAFEEWLNKIDLRNEKQFCKTKIQYNKLPWLPP